MRQTVRVAAVMALTATFSLGGTAWGQSIYGPGGLLLSPTADFPRKGQLSPAFLVLPQESSALGGRRTWVSYTLDYGLSDRVELGITHLKINPSRPPFEDGSTGGFVKLKLLEGKPGGRPDVAVGATYLGGGDADAKVAFLALRFATRPDASGRGARAHLGLLYADQLNEFKRHDEVPYGGIDVDLSRNLIGFAEIRGLMDAKPAGAADLKSPSALGLVWRPASSIKVVVALANNGWSDDHRLSFGVGYSIGGGRPRR
jgi:hypothetical protein